MRLKDVMIRVVRPLMADKFRRAWLAALLAPALFVLGGPLYAQEKAGPPDDDGISVPADVGPLKGFELRGERTTPAPKVTPPPPVAEPEPVAAPPPAATEEAAPAVARPRPAPPQPTATARPAAPVADRQAAPGNTAPAPSPETLPGAPTTAPTEEITAPPSQESAPVEVQTSPPTPTSGFSWTYALVALLAAALIAAGIFLLRKRATRPETLDIVSPQLAAEPVAEPLPVPEPAPVPVPPARRPVPAAAAPRNASMDGGVIGIQIRPWLQLEFKPDRVAATTTETTVQFELFVNNVGNAIAKNVRVEARMFNAGNEQDREINAFFRGPLDDTGSSRILAIPPRKGARVRAGVSMPKEAMREITVEGRRLFIPLVAFNVIYEWGDGKTGQTSMSYLVGREAEAPSDKMGAFRLDLGPRVYRSLGQRPSEVAVRV